jgi:aspartate racemase
VQVLPAEAGINYMIQFKINNFNYMRILGLIGGMSWESTAVYYEIINTKVNQLLGGFHSCKSLLYTVDFDEIVKLQHEEKWDALCEIMSDAAFTLEKAGADLIILCTNTMHICSRSMTERISVPFLHIAEAAGIALLKSSVRKAGLLGTKFTMEKDFYKKILNEKFNIDVIIPHDEEREEVHRVIYEELVHGRILPASRDKFKKIIAGMKNRGAEGIILGCTEIPLLISGGDVELPLFDTTRIHAEMAVERLLNRD